MDSIITNHIPNLSEDFLDYALSQRRWDKGDDIGILELFADEDVEDALILVTDEFLLNYAGVETKQNSLIEFIKKYLQVNHYNDYVKEVNNTHELVVNTWLPLIILTIIVKKYGMLLMVTLYFEKFIGPIIKPP